MVEAAAYAGRGFVYDQLGKVSEAQADWNQAKQFNPRIADYIRVTGITAIDIGNNELAIDIFNRVMRLRDEPDGNDYLFRGQAYTNLEQYSEAIADFTTVLEINPYIYAALFFRGKAYLGAEMYQEAIDDFTAYRKRNLIWPGTLFYRGEAYLGLGDLENAVKDYCAYRVQREPDEALLKLIDERMETIGIARCEG
jgi:tetratricopeptide (TPR) repeat protein